MVFWLALRPRLCVVPGRKVTHLTADLSSVHFHDIKLPELAPCKGIQGNPREFWILNSTPWIPDSRYSIPVSVELEFWTPIVSGMLNSLRCIPESKTQDCGFHKQKIHGFRIPLHGATECLTNQDGLPFPVAAASVNFVYRYVIWVKLLNQVKKKTRKTKKLILAAVVKLPHRENGLNCGLERSLKNLQDHVMKNCIAWLAWLSRSFATVNSLFIWGSCVNVSKAVYFVIFL